MAIKKSSILRLILITVLPVLGLMFSHQAYAGIIIKAPSYLGLNNNLVGYWTFDGVDMGTAGTIAKDKSGNGNTGTLSGSPTKVNGKLGQALNFNGTSDYVGINSAPSLTPTSAYTISGWVKTNSGGSKVFFQSYNQSATLVSGIAAGVDAYTLHPHKFSVVNGVNETVNRFIGIYSTTSVDDNIWHHLVVTYDGSTFALYVDANSEGTQEAINSPAGTSPAYQTPNYINIGKEQSDVNGSQKFWDGQLDEIKVYNRALSATEVQRLYLIGLGSKQNRSVAADGGDALSKGLAGYWSLDGADIGSSGTIAKDRSGNSKNGTLTGANGLPRLATGKVGQALSFDGVDDYVTFGASALDFTGTTPKTFSAWVYGAGGSIFSKYGVTDGQGSYVFSGGAGNQQLYLFTSSYTNRIHKVTTGAPGLSNQWNHVVATWTGGTTSASIKIYVNGVEASYGASDDGGSFTGLQSTTNPTLIGASNTTGTTNFGAFFQGSIDDVRVYNRVLSAEEIKRLYDQTQSKFNSSQTNNLSTGLATYWTFDGADTHASSSNRIYPYKLDDKSGNNNFGTANYLTTQTAGKIGQALSFDGTSQFVSRGSYTLGNPSGTFSLWFKPNWSSGDSANHALFGEGFNAPNSRFFRGEHFTDNNWYFGFFNDAAAGEYRAIIPSSTMSVTSGTWYLLTMTWNATTGSTRVYLNGVQKGSNSTLVLPTLDDTTLFLGKFNTTNVNVGAYFGGSMDDVRIYNRDLSAGEVAKLYNAGR